MSRVKLLSKREIDVRKAQDRQREIAEGTKLAHRVDGLRELAADEEKSLNDFRIKTLTAINEETTPLFKERDELLNELVALRDERKGLLKPLDDEWLKVRAVSKDLDKESEVLAQEKAQLKLAIGANIQREKENTIETERLADTEERVKELLVKIDRMNKDAATDLMNARATAKQIVSNAQAFEASITLREKRATMLEELVEQRRKENDIVTRNNDAERVRIRDAYATLERTKKQIK